MPPNAGSGAVYPPVDLESSQWGAAEHERLAGRSTVLSAPDCATAEPGSAAADYHGQQHTQKRTKVAWVLGGVACLLVLVAATASAAIFAPASHSGSPIATQQQQTAPAAVNERGSWAAGNTAPANTTSSSKGSSQAIFSEGGALPTADDDTPAAAQDSVLPCEGPNLRCAVVNKQPIPEADFRNLPRRRTSSGGMVAADSSRCSEIGRDVLHSGGNAIDATVATTLCQGVVNPSASGLGGGGFITVRLANGTSAFYDARETAPAAAHENMFKDLPSSASLSGGLAVAVPVELQGLEAVWKRFGSKPWSELVKPAADLARTGFAAHPYLVYSVSGPNNLNRIKVSKGLREAFFINDPQEGWRPPKVGELCCKRPKLADTLDKIAAEGASYLASPAVVAAHAAEIKAAGGIITAQDLADAAPQERELLKMQLGELELLLPPPPSSAAVVGFILQFLAGYPNSTRASFGPDPHRDQAVGIHRMVEAMKHGFAVRTALGDPGSKQRAFADAASINAAARDLLSAEFVDAMRAMTKDDDVLPDTKYGGRWNPEGVATPQEHGTTHLCVVDAERNAVSLTTSINGGYGSGVVSDTTGILFGNTMDDFGGPQKQTFVTPHPSKANFIQPGRRPLSAMSPIIVTHKATGRLVAVAGASGGPLIVSATAQTLARLLLEGADVLEAVSAPRLHNQLVPQSSSYVEEFVWGYTHHEVPQFVLDQLSARHQATTTSDRAMGVSQAILVEYNGGAAGDKGVLVGASDSRKDGAPVGEDE